MWKTCNVEYIAEEVKLRINKMEVVKWVQTNNLNIFFPLYYLWCGCVQIWFNKFVNKSCALSN